MAERNRRAWGRFGLAVLMIATVWGGVLPRLAAVPAIHGRVRFLQERKIDPAAFFYTDLECMNDVERKVNESRSHHRAAFGGI